MRDSFSKGQQLLTEEVELSSMAMSESNLKGKIEFVKTVPPLLKI